MQQNEERRRKTIDNAERVKRLEAIRKDSRQGNREVCIVRCKNTRHNHYQGQSYDKRKGVVLASQGWNHGFSKGDHFTICSTAVPGVLASTGDEQALPEVADGAPIQWGGLVGQPPPAPAQSEGAVSFGELGIHADIVANLRRQGIVTPTQIQRRAIPRLLGGGTSLVAAETGCGKTLAFLLPLVERLYRQQLETAGAPAETRTQNQPRALIVTPGRELAEQIRDVAEAVTGELPLRTRLLLGGRTKLKMLRPSLLDMDILVASLGALNKLTAVGVLDLSRVQQLVLDEADSLLDDSFREEVRRLLRRLPAPGEGEAPPALTLVGATLPGRAATAQLLEGLLPADSVREITTRGLHRLLPHVEQTFRRLGSAQRPAALLEICREARRAGESVLVFSNTSQTADWVSLHLSERGVDCLNVHGRMHYKIRQGRWHAFVAGEHAVLSCTDVVSRGLDSVHVHHVVNYDFPWNSSDYIHRAGRVGREGAAHAGRVTSFVSRPLEIQMAQRVETAARTGQPLWNVDANIKHIIEKRIGRREATAAKRRPG